MTGAAIVLVLLTVGLGVLAWQPGIRREREQASARTRSR